VVNKKFTFPFYDCRTVIKSERKGYSYIVRIKGDNRSYGRWEIFLVSTMHTKIALVTCWLVFTVARCSTRLLIVCLRQTTHAKHTQRVIGHKVTAFFRCCYVSESVWGLVELLRGSRLNSQRLVFSMWHREQSIIAVWSRLQIKHLCEHTCKIKWWLHTRAYSCVLRNGVKTEKLRKRKRSNLKRSCIQRNGTLTFYWPLLYVA
jgi:hypothetical protein